MMRSLRLATVGLVWLGFCGSAAEARVHVRVGDYAAQCGSLQDEWDDLLRELAAGTSDARGSEIAGRLVEILGQWDQYCGDYGSIVFYRTGPPVCELDGGAKGCEPLAVFAADRDGDQLLDLYEDGAAQDPAAADTDRDGLPDGVDTDALVKGIHALDKGDVVPPVDVSFDVWLDELASLAKAPVALESGKGVWVSTMTRLEEELGCSGKESEAVFALCVEADRFDTTLPR